MRNHLYAHLDIRSFFGACEQYLNPALKGKALVIYNEGWDKKKNRATRQIIAVSTEAKKLGIDRKIYLWQAEKIAREKRTSVVLVKNSEERRKQYDAVSAELYQKCKAWAEPQGFFVTRPHIDDIVVSCDRGLDSMLELIAKIKKSYKSRGFELATGISFNQDYAHIAAKMSKEYGLIYFGRGVARRWIYQSPAIDFPYIGPKGAEKLKSVNINTIGDVAKSRLELVISLLGKSNGTKIYYSILEAEPNRTDSELFRNIRE